VVKLGGVRAAGMTISASDRSLVSFLPVARRRSLFAICSAHRPPDATATNTHRNDRMSGAESPQ
jgi:hypothetical protein